jgi:hypothetical protein
VYKTIQQTKEGKIMKKISLLVSFVLVFLLLPTWAVAGSVEGSVQGLMCVTLGWVCPTDKEDPMAAAERVFVVLTPSKKYYFVPNVHRTVLVRNINDRVRVTGDLSLKYPSIDAATIDVWRKGEWKTAWSWEEEMQKRLWDISTP